MIVSTKELGELLGLTERHIYNLEKKEVLSKEDKNCWDAYKNIQAYIYYKISIETPTTDGKEARVRKDLADAKLKEVMLAEKLGKLIPIEKVAKELEDIAITISNKLYSIPHQLKRRFKIDDVMYLALENEIENTLKELKDPNIYTQQALEIEEKIAKEREKQELSDE
ncbi:hypothetical protein [Helicobacter sp. 13S00477-4]|uniref:hypothetical protein n=1 Tax=Helicobacter sp. 13S00477-4 TaxID=1905759 RepID=UPI000BA61B1A|nr:hypothetical protein [Helicobacter sp. 13S00477-4]PAF50868.1 hypothetical protein BKH44_06890 [Helicobacter sp. 13S00477-4]